MNEEVKKAAVYARVSIETDRLAHSLAAQKRYYREFIKNKADWELAGVYADSFISGTETAHRTEFNRLISDCEQGRIDIVLCKSISRFARNTVDLLKTVRYLKELGVEVFFEKENLSSLSEDGELVLTILASFAQEESRSISENVKWGIRRRFMAGTAGVSNKRVFGYEYDGEKYIVVPHEAQTVRLIFGEYCDGVPLRAIASHLCALGVKTVRGRDFSHNEIDYIVRNEIYIGNIVFQKTFVRDFITHSRAENRGELPQYRLCDCHEPIISEETFAKARVESVRRSAMRPAYPYSGKIFCAKCGSAYTRRTNNGKYACWHCRGCTNIKLKEDKLCKRFPEPDFTENVRRLTVRGSGYILIEYYNERKEKWRYE